jgi:hypothetical protein
MPRTGGGARGKMSLHIASPNGLTEKRCSRATLIRCPPVIEEYLHSFGVKIVLRTYNYVAPRPSMLYSRLLLFDKRYPAIQVIISVYRVLLLIFGDVRWSPSSLGTSFRSATFSGVPFLHISVRSFAAS